MPRTKSEKALSNRRIVITRPHEQNAELGALLSKHGASVLEMPLIEIDYAENEDVAKEIFDCVCEYDWLVFTSANGVRGFFRQFFARFRDMRSLGPCRIACVGPATARAVEELHLEVDCVPEEHTGAALAEKIVSEHGVENLKICVITGNQNSTALAETLEKARGIVDVFPVYETGENDVSEHPSLADFRKNGADAIVFASGSAVKSFVSQAALLKLEKDAVQPRVVAIGAPTASALKAAGIPVSAIAEKASAPGILDAVLGIF